MGYVVDLLFIVFIKKEGCLTITVLISNY